MSNYNFRSEFKWGYRYNIINLHTAVCTGEEVTQLLITIPNITEADVYTMPQNTSTVDYNETMATLRMHSFM